MRRRADDRVCGDDGALGLRLGVHRRARPIVLYAHGTTTDKAFTMTDLGNAESLALAAVFASQGYIVVAPTMPVMTSSTLSYHPYLVAAQQSHDMMNALSAARAALPLASTATTDGGRLFITGSSQGGYVAMATQRAMEAAGQAVTAARSGPYALAAFGDAVFDGEVNGGAPISTTFLLTAYQASYGDIYGSTGEVFEPQYAAGIGSLLPTDLTRSELYAQGLLPQAALSQRHPAGSPVRGHHYPEHSGEPGGGVRARVRHGRSDPEQLSAELPAGRPGQSGRWFPDPDDRRRGPGAAAAVPEALARNDLRDWVPVAPCNCAAGTWIRWSSG